ncbi:hypothetical protein [Kribbella sp. NPDC049584]|uniref:hypothetical protein n=1 Tax=Kribbella sp. NPDC049584 TaxID=3154833 RepID=UPI003423DFDE
MTRDMRQLDYAELRTIMGEQPYPLLFATPAYLPELMVAKAEAEHAPLDGPSGERLSEDVTRLS